MKLLHLILVILILINIEISAQVVTNYRLQEGIPDRGGLVGNSITDLVWFDSTLYAGSGYGLSITPDLGETWQNYTPSEYGGQGGLSALTIAPDSTVWIATGYDTTVQDDQTLAVGGGLRHWLPRRNKWEYIPQPKDARTDTLDGKKPTTTRVQNITYDIAVHVFEQDTQIWIASFGGGIRRSLDMGKSWEVKTTDSLPFSAGDYLNHRGFSVMSENGNIWVGTAEGISKSADGGETWKRFLVENNEPQPGTISGNWVIALAHNPWDNSVWAVTLSTGGDEYNAISRTLDGGRNWDIFLEDELSDGTFARYIAFHDSAVYVATEKGVYKSINSGQSWYKFPSMTDRISGEQILTEEFFSVATSPGDGLSHWLWAGSGDGLAASPDNGYTWTVFRSFVSTRHRTDPPVYAYPTPFSPARGDYVRFQYDIAKAGPVKIDIYNFAMEKVISLQETENPPLQNTFDRSAKWDGRDNNGRMVDNGVYFFRAQVEGEVTWGKVVVVN